MKRMPLARAVLLAAASLLVPPASAASADVPQVGAKSPSPATTPAAKTKATPRKGAAGTPKPGAASLAPTLPPIYDTEAQARPSVEAMQVVCSQSNRRMLVNFGVNDCQPCRVVSDAIAEPAFFDAMIKQIVPLFVDVTPGSKNEAHFHELARRFGMDTRKLPAILILDDKGSFLEADTKGEVAAAAALGKEEVQRWIVARLYATN